MTDCNRKWIIINSLCEASIKMDCNEKWYVCQPVDEGGDGFFRGILCKGDTPEEAIDNHFKKITELPSNKYLIVTQNNKRLQFRWNNYIWKIVGE